MPADCVPRPRDATVTEPHLLLDTDVLIEVLCGNPKTGGTGLHTEVSGDTGYSAATDSGDGGHRARGVLAGDGSRDTVALIVFDDHHVIPLTIGDGLGNPTLSFAAPPL